MQHAFFIYPTPTPPFSPAAAVDVKTRCIKALPPKEAWALHMLACVSLGSWYRVWAGVTDAGAQHAHRKKSRLVKKKNN